MDYKHCINKCSSNRYPNTYKLESMSGANPVAPYETSMGRKRWWKGGLELLVLCFFHSVIHGDGEVGCLFSKNVCRSGMETCYDDLAFGRCMRPFDELDDEDVYRYDLDASELELLRKRLQRLVVDGYEWTHPYTQCIMQGSLYSLRYKLKDELEFCRELAELEHTFDEYEEDEEPEEESQPLAVVNFTPTRGHGYGDFADEKYYPPAVSLKKPKHNRRPVNEEPEEDYTYSYSSFRKKPERQRVAKLENIFVDEGDSNEENLNDDNTLMDSSDGSTYVEPNFNPKSRNFRELAQRLDTKYDQPMYRLRRQPYRDDQHLQNFKTSSLKLNLESAKDILRNSDREISKVGRDYRYWNPGVDKYLWKFTKNGLLAENETFPKSGNDKLKGLEFLRNENDDDRDEEEDGRWMNINTGDEEEEEDNNESDDGISPLNIQGSLDRSTNRQTNGMYTEGGLVQPLDIRDAIRQVSVPDDIVFDDDLLLWSRDLAAFQRNERLDVKKPGPLFSTNNYAFKTQSPPVPAMNDRESLEDRQENDEILRSSLVKKKIDDKQTYDNVDLDHVYIQFDSDFTNWNDGEKVVEEVARLLDYSPDIFSDVRVGRAEVTFKVNGESPNDAIGIAPKIGKNSSDNIHEELRENTGRMVVRAGVGDKVKLPPSMEVKAAPKMMSTGVFGAIVAAGGAAVAAAAVVILIIARKHAKSRAKLAGLTRPDPEASKDYQDLCRARMQAKQPNEKPESPRIISLSRESESNRSSTSSWGEEAAALTNMDISTGHMVLTYMEDHLKNKDRLDQEWAGICAYEAEPSSVAIASNKSNADRNRPGSSLPYDHSRVVLNDLSNAVNSNYINASTITPTDHDPRNPAYIATQGPLPQTSADFWQLVWEQGSVVIVMLTRLTEEGRGMCHRYWPEEGSELYHIYEVHLVSEHIWCDDYLVRSFYLKNLRTGETRTVTQFHFLSWPENDVPHSTKAMLEFRRKVNKSYRGRSCPIVVHCSDGAGRTGTYCLIDMVLNRMAKGAKEIDIAAALEHIRDQRPGMVATKQQFEFVLGAVAEEVHAILKALPVQPTEKTQLTGTASSASQIPAGSEQ